MAFLAPALLLFSLLAACAGAPVTVVTSRANPLPETLPKMKTFATAAAPAGRAMLHANADIARDFLELAFEMESGKKIPRLSKFDGPVTVAFAKAPPPQFQADLATLLARVRNEAGIDIKQGKTGEPASIVIETLPRRTLHSTVPQAACFVVPRVKNWREFRRNRRSGALDWTTVLKRSRATVFIPDDVAPQEARDCLNEEITQALGPLNDVYRLPDSIYNDDNMNVVVTAFDMLILKTYYDPALRIGMRRTEVAAALPAILRRLNPDGETVPRDGLQKSPRIWIDTLEKALGPNGSASSRLAFARKAVRIAQQQKWQDNRLGFSLFAQGRLALGHDSALAIASFKSAYEVYARRYGVKDIHTAHVALQMAAFALSTGKPELALDLINTSLPTVSDAKNAALLATFLMIKAAAMDALGRHRQAATVRLDSIGWARYGFASKNEIGARLRETAALRPRKPRSGT